MRYGSIVLEGGLEEGEVRPCTAPEKVWAEQVMKSSTSRAKNALKAMKKEGNGAPPGKKLLDREEGSVRTGSKSMSKE